MGVFDYWQKNPPKYYPFVEKVNEMNFFILMFSFIIFFTIFQTAALSEVIVYDMIAIRGEEVLLKSETKGKFFSKGGIVVEFIVDGKSIGKSLSGGDGFAFKQFKPLKIGTYKITVKSGGEEGKALLLSLRKGEAILLMAEGSLFEEIFSEKPKEGSKETIAYLSGRFPVVLLQTGLLTTKAIKVWLKQNGFKELPVIPYAHGTIFDEVKEKGMGIKAVIGSKSVIESAKKYKPKSFSFEYAEGAEEVKDWWEIGKKLK